MKTNQRMFAKLTEIFQENLPVWEVLSVYHGLRKACRLVVTEKQINQLKQLIEGRLSICIQDFKVNLVPDKGKGSSTNRFSKVPIDCAKGRFLAYLAKSEKKAFLAKTCEQWGDDKNFGKMLGYPDCCIDFFIANREAQDHKQMDFIAPACTTFEPFPFVNNYCLRYFDKSFLCHFPCSFSCKKSEKQGKAVLKLIREYSSHLAMDHERALKSFVLYTEYEGVFYCPEYTLKKNVITYKRNIFGTQKNWILDLLGENRSIECFDYDRFRIGDHLFNNDSLILTFR